MWGKFSISKGNVSVEYVGPSLDKAYDKAIEFIQDSETPRKVVGFTKDDVGD